MFFEHIYSKEAVGVKKILSHVCFLSIIIYMLIFPKEATDEARKAVMLCADTIIPSLFVFLLCSNFLINTGFAKIIKKPFEKIMYPLFAINGSGALAMILGYVSGYPIGAVCTCELYKKGDLSKDEAERLLGFCNNAGPLFIVGSLGAIMLKSKESGYLLWLVHIVSSLISGMVLRLFSKVKVQKSVSTSSDSMIVGLLSAFSGSIKNAIISILNICAYTVLFSIVISMIFCIFGVNRISIMNASLIEITNSINKICLLKDELFGGRAGALPYIAFALGFGGMCVHLQVISVVKNTDLGLKKYFAGKVLQGFISAATVLALTKMLL